MSAPFIVVTDDQRTPEWHQARVGMLTGTDAKSMLATIKSGEAAARRDLRTSLVVERLTGKSAEDGFVSDAMKRGTELEPDAVTAYELATDRMVSPVGFIRHPELPTGCSLDGQVQNFAGIVEIKCPKSATHLSYLRGKRLPPDYVPQVTHNMWISGAQWCDFVSYDSRFPAELQLFIVRVLRSELDMAAYELAVRLFLSEVAAEEAEVRGLMVAA